MGTAQQQEDSSELTPSILEPEDLSYVEINSLNRIETYFVDDEWLHHRDEAPCVWKKEGELQERFYCPEGQVLIDVEHLRLGQNMNEEGVIHGRFYCPAHEEDGPGPYQPAHPDGYRSENREEVEPRPEAYVVTMEKEV